MTRSAREIIKAEYGDSKNFITPYSIKTGKINKNLAYEISYGFGMDNNKLYGLTIVEDIEGKTKRRYDLSGCFSSMEEVKNKIEEIKNALNR
jgi:hypothetical protein